MPSPTFYTVTSDSQRVVMTGVSREDVALRHARRVYGDDITVMKYGDYPGYTVFRAYAREGKLLRGVGDPFSVAGRSDTPRRRRWSQGVKR